MVVRINIIMDMINLIVDIGFPAAGAAASGYFVFLTLKFILAGVSGSVKTIESMIVRLDSRVGSMNNDVQRIDVKISHALGLQPDYHRISRANAKDLRRD